MNTTQEMSTKMKRLFIFFLLTFSANLFPSQNHAQMEYKVFYIPFDVNFYVPVTAQDIEKRAFKIGTVKSKKMDQIFSELEKQCNGIKEELKDIRIKVENKNKLMFLIDASYNILFNSKKCNVDKKNVLKHIRVIDVLMRKVKLKKDK